jgi:hypothetical protein
MLTASITSRKKKVVCLLTLCCLSTTLTYGKRSFFCLGFIISSTPTSSSSLSYSGCGYRIKRKNRFQLSADTTPGSSDFRNCNPKSNNNNNNDCSNTNKNNLKGVMSGGTISTRSRTTGPRIPSTSISSYKTGNPFNDLTTERDVEFVVSKKSAFSNFDVRTLSYKTLAKIMKQSQVVEDVLFASSASTKTRNKKSSSIQLVQKSHHHNDNFEGAVYGLTSMLILSYSAIFFLYNPSSMFSASELCWATTNGYIFALISHFLRRNERIRLHELHHVVDSSLLSSSSSSSASTSCSTSRKASRPSIQPLSNQKASTTKVIYMSRIIESSSNTLESSTTTTRNSNPKLPTQRSSNPSKYSISKEQRQVPMKRPTTNIEQQHDFLIQMLRLFQNDACKNTKSNNQKTVTSRNKAIRKT